LHPPKKFFELCFGREIRPAVALEQLQTVAPKTAPHTALTVPPLVVQAFGKLAERDKAQLVHAAMSASLASM
jgi:hypothetical protein